VVLVLFLALVAGGVAAWRQGLLEGRLDALLGGPADPGDAGGPAAVAPPLGLDLPPVVAPDPVAAPSSPGGALDPEAVRRALAPYLDDPDLGRHVRAAVAPLGGGPPVFASGRRPAIPASTTKLVTATAALLALGPDHVFSTTARLGPVAGARARLTLVGGGDPFLERAPIDPEGEPWPYPARADLTTLAALTADALADDGVRRVRLTYDDTLFTGPAVNPRWEADYVPDGVVSPTSALWVDAGRTLARDARVPDAAREAADAFATALRAAGVAVDGPPAAGVAPSAGREVAAVDGAPLAAVVQRLLDVSDNEAAEVLLRHVGLARSGTGSTEAGRRGVRALLAEAGVPLGTSTFLDGSGLARGSRAEPGVLVDVLQLAADPRRPELRAVVEGLPVAGFTGSLTFRMEAGPAAGLGRVRAKTGTLSSVSSLAGTGTDLDGVPFAFVLMADTVGLEDTLDARQAIDSAAASLGACRCAR
jgi:D-alanyl-D-alanine carboxypeptidase/D-alanyl-D-alanine-endopeptidase (penicillin-binding protein 4)